MDTQTITQIQKITEDLLNYLKAQAVSTVEVDESEIIKVNIYPKDVQEGAGILIGFHGETLRALQLVVSMMVNKGRESWLKIEVDVDSYRKNHIESVRSLARRTAEKVSFLQEPVALSPMPAVDRRVVHLAIGEIEGVESESVGEGRDRKVVVKPTLQSP